MMITSTVRRGLPSCLEPSLVDPLASMFQLARPEPDISLPRTKMPSLCNQENLPHPKNTVTKNNHSIKKVDKNVKSDCWGSIQSVSKSCQSSENVYVHPLEKRSSCTMSTRSLEMCTESLGCETGSNMNGGMDEFDYLLSMERQNSTSSERPKTREICKKMSENQSFPPPLTSISGSNGVQVSTHREGGRLLIKAVNSPSCNLHFKTERENGRLRLCLPKEDNWHFNKHLVGDNEEDQEKEERIDEPEDGGVEVEDGEEENDNDNNNGGFWAESGGKIGCKIGKTEWSGRCKEENKRIPSFPICVAIS